MTTAAEVTNKLGKVSPVGSTHTEKFPDYESESGKEQEQEQEEVQPVVDEVEPGFGTPFKNHVPPSSGTTPIGENSFNHRVHLSIRGGPNYLVQPGVKGWREESPIKLYPPTPTR